MTVREFADGQLVTTTGGLSGMTHGTVAVLFKPRDFSATQSIFRPHNSGGSNLGMMLGITASTGLVQWAFSGGSSGPALGAGTWYTAVMRKDTGTVTPRFSVYNHTTTTWAHANGSTTRPDLTAPGAGTIRMSLTSSSEFFDGWMAARAAWANSLPWSADTTGDTAIEAEGLHTALQTWVDAAPSAGWVFDQASEATTIPDWTGGGADQSSVTGSTAVTGDDPPGFDFTLGGGATVAFTRPVYAPTYW